MEKIHVPSLNYRRYAETFAVFVKHSLEYPQMLDELESISRKHLKQGFRVLDIGAGTGMVIQEWIERTSLRPGYYTAFEPNSRHLDVLSKTIVKLGLHHDIQRHSFTVNSKLSHEYDIALFSHSLYWMPDPGLHILHAASFLADGGLAVAFIGGPYGVYLMFPLFEPYLVRTTPMLQNNSMSSHEVVQSLRENGKEPTVRMLPTPIDLTDLFDQRDSKELEEFISFCMQLEFSLLPRWLQSDIIQYVRGGCVQQGDRLYWYLPTAAIMVKN